MATRSEITVNGLTATERHPTRSTSPTITTSPPVANFKRLLILVHISAGTGTGGAVTLKGRNRSPCS